MHAFFVPFGIFPNNAIVGGSADIATGAALYKKACGRKGVVVANIGDASIGCGPVWEAMGFAAMDQYRTLWEKDVLQPGLPLIFNFMDNFYGMGGQPIGETMGFERLARAGAGVNPEKMHAECVDGNNPLALADAYKRKKRPSSRQARPGVARGHLLPADRPLPERPVLATASARRSTLWRAVDPLTEFGEGSSRRRRDRRQHRGGARLRDRKVTKACKLATNEDIARA